MQIEEKNSIILQSVCGGISRSKLRIYELELDISDLQKRLESSKTRSKKVFKKKIISLSQELDKERNFLKHLEERRKGLIAKGIRCYDNELIVNFPKVSPDETEFLKKLFENTSKEEQDKNKVLTVFKELRDELRILNNEKTSFRRRKK